jgi:3-phenylpropionate/trans-cinnamate dioxygenase ferredoxin reductase component
VAYRTIVIGTDGSPTAGLALRAASRLARRLGAELVLVCAFDPPRITREMAQSFLEYAQRAAGREGVAATTELDRAAPADLILGVAERRSADLIVVGNKGMGSATRFRLGSVPDRVAHAAPCDLLIVDTTGRPGLAPGRGADQSFGEYARILVGTDGSPTATEAARISFELAMMLGASVTLAYVGDPLLGAIALEDTAAIRPEGVDLSPVVVDGDPAEELVRIAESEGVDLVVVGNRGLSGTRRFFLGSVPNKVAHYASTDVLIVKTVDRSAADLAPGHGGIVDMGGKKLAVYRDENGRLHALSPRCTHMGCTVGWNDADRTWDCPCHGSRYAVDGRVVQGPAARPLEPAGGEPGEAPPEADDTPEGAAQAQAAPVTPRPAVRSDRRFVVVGASLAGGTAAATLREEGFDGRLVLVGAEASFPYERPPLSKAFLRGEVPLEAALVRPPSFYADNEIDTRFGTTVIGVDPVSRTLTVAGGDPIGYDRLLIATGAKNRRFPIPGLGLAGVLDLRTSTDAALIRAEMIPGRRAVVVGMGFIGSEVAASLRLRGLEVTVVDGNAAPLERVLGPEVGGVLEAIHRDHGVTMAFRDRAVAFEGNGRVERLITSAGLRIECDFAVVGVGVEPVADLVSGSGIEVDNGILVDELCRTNVDGVFAAGDVANHFHPVFGRRIRTEHWQNALRQGRAAALNMLDRAQPYDAVHWFWSDQYDHNLQYAGFHTDWDEIVVRGSLGDRRFSAFYLKDGRVQAVVALDRGDDVTSATSLIRSGAPVEPARLRDEDVDLSTMA